MTTASWVRLGALRGLGRLEATWVPWCSLARLGALGPLERLGVALADVWAPWRVLGRLVGAERDFWAPRENLGALAAP